MRHADRHLRRRGASLSIIDTSTNNNNEAYVYWGTPQGGGSFTDPNSVKSTYANTGNYANLASMDVRMQNNGFGGGSTGESYETWNQFVAMDGGVQIGYITIDLDGGFTGNQVMDTTDFDINNTVYTPTITPTVPEPRAGGLVLVGALLLAGIAFCRFRSARLRLL